MAIALQRFRAMRVGQPTRAAVLIACASCAHHVQIEDVGSGNALVVPRGAPAGDPTAGLGAIQLPKGSYQIQLRFDVPRAQQIDWAIQCPGSKLAGGVGETLEHYRERKLAQLRATFAPPPIAVVPAPVAPPPPPYRPRADAVVHTPVGTAVIHADGPPVPVTPAPPPAPVVVVPPPVVVADIQLPPGDVGRGSLYASAFVTTRADGACSLTATTDDPDVIASFHVARVRDLDAEERVRRMTVATGALHVRARLRDQLVEAGAVAHAHAELVAEGEGEIYGEFDAEAEHEGRCTAEAERVRERYVAWLVELGAHRRPPRPAAPSENPGAPPFPGAEWIAGRWTWQGQWTWIPGNWVASSHSHARSIDLGPPRVVVPIPVPVPIGVDVRVGPPDPPVRDHRH